MSYGDLQLNNYTQHRINMPGMIQPENPINSSHHSSLQSFSSLALSPALSNGISPQHMMMIMGSHLTQSSSSLSSSSTTTTLSSSSVTSSASASSTSGSPSWVTELRSEERGLLIIQLLLKCAGAVAGKHMDYTNLLLEQLSLLASIRGDPMQRVATHFMEGLAARAIKSWPGLYKALNCTQLQSPSDALSARQIFFNLCPYLKFAFTIVNHSILDAMEGEKVVHIIDLGASEAIQWVALLQMLSTRLGGPPHLRITIINPRKDVLDQLGQRLSEEAEALDIPFQFHPLVCTRLEDLDVEMLRVKTGEAVAITSVLQLHYLLSEEEKVMKTNPASFHGSSTQSPSITTTTPHHACMSSSSSSTHGMNTSCAHHHHQHNHNHSHSHNHNHNDNHNNNQQQAMSTCSPHCFMGSSSTSVSSSTTSNGIHAACCSLASPCMPSYNGIHGITAPCNNPHPGNIPSSPNIITTNRSNTNPHIPNPNPNSQCTKAERALCMLRSLSPKIMVVMEQESNHNGSDFVERFVAALHYYSAMFDSLECSLPPKLCGERLAMEKHLFGRQIHNIVACEGLDRVERHEKLDQWRSRIEWAGFSHVSFSYSSMIQAKRLLLSYNCEGYRLVEDRGCLTVCWQDTPLFSASAWQA